MLRSLWDWDETFLAQNLTYVSFSRPGKLTYVSFPRPEKAYVRKLFGFVVLEMAPGTTAIAFLARFCTGCTDFRPPRTT